MESKVIDINGINYELEELHGEIKDKYCIINSNSEDDDSYYLLLNLSKEDVDNYKWLRKVKGNIIKPLIFDSEEDANIFLKTHEFKGIPRHINITFFNDGCYRVVKECMFDRITFSSDAFDPDIVEVYISDGENSVFMGFASDTNVDNIMKYWEDSNKTIESFRKCTYIH